ncbi:hypothetical protein [Alsobacter sp. SYSU BS001988]|jgi:hypothetical protein
MTICESNHEEIIFEGMRDELRHLFDVGVGDADWSSMRLDERAAWLREMIERVFAGDSAQPA